MTDCAVAGAAGIAVLSISCLFKSAAHSIQDSNTSSKTLRGDINDSYNRYALKAHKNYLHITRILDSIFRHSIYIAGISYGALGYLLKAAADAMVPQTLAAPLVAQSIIYATFLDSFFLFPKTEDRSKGFGLFRSVGRIALSRETKIACFFIGIGIFLAIFNSNSCDGMYSLHDISEKFLETNSWVATITLILCYMILKGLISIFGQTPSTENNISTYFPSSNSIVLVYFLFISSVSLSAMTTLIKALIEIMKYNFIMASSDAMLLLDAFGIGVILALAIGFYTMNNKSLEAAEIEFNSSFFLPLYKVIQNHSTP